MLEKLQILQINYTLSFLIIRSASSVTLGGKTKIYDKENHVLT